MRRSFLLTPAARSDLIEIADYLRRQNPRAAGRVLAALREAIRRLTKWPQIGHLRQDLAEEELRFWPVHSYLIV